MLQMVSYDARGVQVACVLTSGVSQVEVQRRPWVYEDENGRQVGGFVKEFDSIAFLTVKVNLLHSHCQLILSGPVMSLFTCQVLMSFVDA